MLSSPYRLQRPLLLMLLSLTVVSLAYYVLLLLDATNNLHVYTNPKKNGSKNNVDVRPCSPTTPLGPIPVDTTAVGLNELDEQFPEVTRGGHYVPPNCTSDRVAIIVPYRNRPHHLTVFLKHMHALLMTQQLYYGIYVIEQYGSSPFNRGKLMNVGFQESVRLSSNYSNWQCFVFHDVDLLPLDTRNLYTCPDQPRHMSVAIDKFNFTLPLESIVSGVLAMSFKQFTDVNGFSNSYWSRGCENDDLYNRLVRKNYKVTRYNESIARYIMMNHTESENSQKGRDLYCGEPTVNGLSTLDYKVLAVKEKRLFTYVLVNIEEPTTTTTPLNQTVVTGT